MIKNKKSLLAAFIMLFSLMAPGLADATQLTQAGIRFGRLSEGATTGNDLLVTFKLFTTPTSVAKISVAIPTGYTVTANASITVGTTGFPNTPASITAPPGSLTGVSTSGGGGLGGTIVVSGLTSASLSGSTLYGFTIPSGIVQNPTTPGQYIPSVASQNSGGTPIDTTLTPTYIYGASPNQDQDVVTASVAPNFTFQLSANSDTVPQVDSSTVKTSGGITMTVATNSPLGYTAYVKSANAALNSATSPGTPIATGTFDGTPDSFPAGSTKYGFVPSTGTACSICTGSIAYDSEYNGLTGTTAGSFNGTNFASFVSRTGYTNSDQITLKERVTVANTVIYANDYTDTLTIVAAGNY